MYRYTYNIYTTFKKYYVGNKKLSKIKLIINNGFIDHDYFYLLFFS